MSFVAYDLSLEYVRAVAPLLATLRSRDPALARQARAAVASICLNLAEGSGRAGADRRHLFRIARSSFNEVSAAFDVTVALGLVDAPPAPDLTDRLGDVRRRRLRRRRRPGAADRA